MTDHWLDELRKREPEAAELIAEMRSENAKMREALKLVRRGLTSADNKCWPTVKPWTKKERDEAMLTAVREALESNAPVEVI
jgi:hypothetical protein